MGWLEPRLTDVPVSLRVVILDVVRSGSASRGQTGGRADGRALFVVLNGAAEELMLEAKSGPPTHDIAMRLLAADALITFAQEALAELEPERLAETQ